MNVKSAEKQGCPEAKVASTFISTGSLKRRGRSLLDGSLYSTLYQGFHIGKATANKNGDDRCLGYRIDRTSDYTWLTYEDTERAASNIGSALIKLGETHGQNTFIGIYATNSVEWLVTALACNFHSMIYVPLYDTLGEAAIIHIMNQTGLKTIFIDKEENVKKVLDLSREVSNLKRIIIMKTISREKFDKLGRKGARRGIEVHAFQRLLKIGRKSPVPHHPPKSKHLFEICYTSGTTGLPKGAMYSHKNMVSTIRGTNDAFATALDKSEVLISYLPLAHIYEQMVEFFCLCNGFKIGYYLGDVNLLTDDMARLKPTLMPSVPRLLNRMYDSIQAMIRQSQLTKKESTDSKENSAQDSEAQRRAMQAIMMKKFQETLGGRVKLIATGAAPIAPNVLTFLRAASGAQIIEGYGQTECCGLSTCQKLNDPSVGHVGVPTHCNMIKLVDVPDMNYFAKDNVGEVCIKGPNVFTGYFRDEEKTKEALDEQGWLHTGDVGRWTENGYLQIIDRKKHLFKLSQGEYLSPERIENIYVQSRYVLQAFVYGNSYKSRTVAIIVPDPVVLLKYASDVGLGENIEELCKTAAIKDLIFNDIKELEKSNQLKGFEMAKEIYLHSQPFSVENNLLTPTMKSKRPELTNFFQKQIDQMYTTID